MGFDMTQGDCPLCAITYLFGGILEMVYLCLPVFTTANKKDSLIKLKIIVFQSQILCILS